MIEDTVLELLTDNDSLTDLVGTRIYVDPPLSKSPPALPWLHYDCELVENQNTVPQTGVPSKHWWSVVVDIWADTHIDYSQIVNVFLTELNNEDNVRVKNTVISRNPEDDKEYRGSLYFTILA